MKSLLLVVALLVTGAAAAQDKQAIIGKWRVAAMYDDKIYYDLIKDSLHLGATAGEGMTVQAKDSVAKEAKKMLHELFRDAFYEFHADMTYIEHLGISGENNGFYNIDEVQKVISTTREKLTRLTGEKKKIEEKITYSFKGNRLVFLSRGADDGPTVEFEKQ